MANECKIEYYFKREELEKLLKAHPTAKGIIISHEIVKEKPKGAASYVNVVHIKARVDKPKSSAKLMGDGEGGDDGGVGGGGGIAGCPYPPGCN